MDIGVWVNTSDAVLTAEFRHALDFWANVLDMTWHEEDTPQCSVQVAYGGPSLFNNDVVAARSQFVDGQNFHGWIAFNPKCKLSRTDTYLTAIHEFGHMLGLRHNPNPKSIMYFLDPDDPPLLDPKDHTCLIARHKVRDPEATLKASARALFKTISNTQ